MKNGWKKAKTIQVKRNKTEATDRVVIVQRALQKLTRQELTAVEFFCHKRSGFNPREGYNLLVYYVVMEDQRRDRQA